MPIGMMNRGVQDIFILCSDGLNGLKALVNRGHALAS